MHDNTDIYTSEIVSLALDDLRLGVIDPARIEEALDFLLVDAPDEQNISLIQSTFALDSSWIGNEEFSFKTLDGIADTIENHKLEAISYLAKKVAIKSIRLSVKGLLFITGLGADISKRTDLITGYWDKSMKMYIGKVDDMFFNKKEFTLLPMEYISGLSEIVLNTFVMMQSVKDLVFDSSATTITSKLAGTAKAYSKYGIAVNFQKGSFADDIRERRKHDTLANNGWSKSNFPSLAARMAKIGKALHKQGDHAAVITGFDVCAKTIVDELGAINAKVDSGRLDKDSDEYKKAMNRILVHSYRLTACSLLLRVATAVAEHLVKDTVYVFRAMESEILDIKEEEND